MGRNAILYGIMFMLYGILLKGCDVQRDTSRMAFALENIERKMK